MPDELKTSAIILNTRPYGESDLVVTLLTEAEGLLTCFARGARKSRKRFPGGLEPFTLAVFGLKTRGAGMPSIVSMDVADAHLGIRAGLDRINAGAVMLELASVFAAPGDASGEVYRLFRVAVKLLEGAEDPWALAAACMVKTLNLAGYRVPCETCARCGEPLAGREGVYVGGSGIFCTRCAGGSEGPRLGPGAAAFIRMAGEIAPEGMARLRLSGDAARALFRFLGAYAASVSGRRLRSLKGIGT